MRVSRPKTQCMDLMKEHNDDGTRNPVKIPGEEQESVTHIEIPRDEY